MRIINIKTLTIPQAWWELLLNCLAHGHEYTIKQGSHNENKMRKELDFVVIQITHPSIRPLVPTVPEGIPVPTSMDYVEKDYLPYLLTNNKGPKEEYTYGQYFESQYLKCLEILRTAGEATNQACATIGDMHSIDMPDPPCLRMIDMRIRYGKLHWFIYFRSWDAFGGFPSNIAGLQLAKEMMAKDLGVEDGELIATSKGVHLYDDAWEWAKMITDTAAI